MLRLRDSSSRKVPRGGLLSEHQVADGVGAAGSSIATDEGGAHLWIAPSGLKFPGHPGEEPIEDKFGFHPDDRVVGT